MGDKLRLQLVRDQSDRVLQVIQNLTGSALLGGFLGTIGFIAGIFMVLGPVLELIFAYGAFKLYRWAWATGFTCVPQRPSINKPSSA